MEVPGVQELFSESRRNGEDIFDFFFWLILWCIVADKPYNFSLSIVDIKLNRFGYDLLFESLVVEQGEGVDGEVPWKGEIGM